MIDRLKTLRKSITTVQREGQAPRPTKSGWDSADTESYRRIQMLALRKVRGIMRFWKFRAARGITVFSRLNAVCAYFVAIAEKNDYN
ncbi:hypothetical protein EUBSIR_02171 [[Eubacterium] siraeum DSM 15702]|uniref:Uncharacterized protein n=1 Tax=[Eubacterium] siraeum DSM 15702 TaxID=428128 RepID=B0MQQ4_9FIRM|nr:hypothetical protein EUBSIR_02171 [[Eubacterium] siraeum DSM 15702]